MVGQWLVSLGEEFDVALGSSMFWLVFIQAKLGSCTVGVTVSWSCTSHHDFSVGLGIGEEGGVIIVLCIGWFHFTWCRRFGGVGDGWLFIVTWGIRCVTWAGWS